ncbi:MAG: lactate utilization protein [Desulfarculus sp.]|jgi:L-lactate utilization protein LutB|nr:MAG: lactate utilization protein [Desulfarculus sp.]
MDEHQIAWNQKTAQHLIKQLTKRRFAASFAPSAAQAVEQALAMIPEGSQVFRCGSMSATYAGLWERLAQKGGVEVINPYLPRFSPEESLAERRRGLSADFMVASTNAITLDGRLVNLDGMGNRVAALSFGPKKVILIVGMNKVVADLESALSRVKHYAAPVNNIRLGLPNPCTEDGLCHDCRGPKRICNIWTITEGNMIEGRIHVLLVGEDLGY